MRSSRLAARVRVPVALATVGLAAWALLGCSTLNPTSPAAAQLAASDFNQNTRFGRMELASEQVMPSEQKDFFEHHKGWGGTVRIADAEMVGMKMKEDDDAEISVRVSWFRVDEEELHLTTLKQTWHINKGQWRVAKEVRSDGDVGLIGEHIEQAPDAPLHENVRYPTIRIGSR